MLLTHIYIYIIMIWRLKYAIDPHLYIYHSDMETEICYFDPHLYIS